MMTLLNTKKRIPTEIKLVFYVVSLYIVFIYWGYLQEKLTSNKYEIFRRKYARTYSRSSIESVQWQYPFVLNLSMAFISSLIAFVVEIFFHEGITQTPPSAYWKAALSSALASPIGYTSLRYITYPLMVLTKSSKPVPVMFVGTVFYKQKYQWHKYFGIALVCTGITFFSSYKVHNADSVSSSRIVSTPNIFFGIFLVLLNLSLDGYTSNEQDHIFSKYSVTPLEMMKYTNFWQFIYIFSFLFLLWIVYGRDSEASKALEILSLSKDARADVFIFSFCAAVGQILILYVIKEFGALVWVTVSVTRQLFTILLSVFIFSHPVNAMQWLGVALVFSGLGLDIAFSYVFLGTEPKIGSGMDGSAGGISSGSRPVSPSHSKTTGIINSVAYMRKGVGVLPAKSDEDIEAGDVSSPTTSASKLSKGRKRE